MDYVIYNGELYHHGIKGQKWGIRRYQNPDGSLTPAGKKRYRMSPEEEAKGLSDRELRTRINRMNLEKRYMNAVGSKSKLSRGLDNVDQAVKTGEQANKTANAVGQLRGKSIPNADTIGKGFDAASKGISVSKKVSKIADEKRVVKLTKSKLENMSDEDLRKIVERMELERQYSSVKTEHANRGRVKARDVLSIAADVIGFAAAAATLAVAIKTLMDNT